MNAAVNPRAAAAADTTETTRQFLTFEVAAEVFAIPILAVQEIRGWEKVARMPRTQNHILGVINLRGTVVPVLDVRTRLGIEPREVTATTVVIVVLIQHPQKGALVVGCVVDAVSDVATIDAAQIRPAPDACGSVESHFIQGVASIDERLVLLLDLQRLIEQSGADAPLAAVPAPVAPSGESLFDRLGGTTAVDAAVDLFYGKVLADPLLAGFFTGTDMVRQKAMQRAFLTVAFGGPNSYSGRSLRAAHTKAAAGGLNDRHFDAVVGHLGATLTELGVAPGLIAQAAAVAESVRADVLCR